MGENRAVIDESLLAKMAQCGVTSPGIDNLSTPRAESWIWSWAEQEPAAMFNTSSSAQAGDQQCTTIHAFDGRWRSADCTRVSSNIGTACKASLRTSSSNSTEGGDGDGGGGIDTTGTADTGWVLYHGAYGECPPGYTFSLPSNGLENSRLRALMMASFAKKKGMKETEAWLNVVGPFFEV